ncbi:UNVERIFIED_CONTAM: hypothetical protein FKN15_042840 [Acipenser sinensis]
MQPPRATALEDNAALGSLQASLQAPGQTTWFADVLPSSVGKGIAWTRTDYIQTIGHMSTLHECFYFMRHSGAPSRRIFWAARSRGERPKNDHTGSSGVVGRFALTRNRVVAKLAFCVQTPEQAAACIPTTFSFSSRVCASEVPGSLVSTQGSECWSMPQLVLEGANCRHSATTTNVAI